MATEESSPTRQLRARGLDHIEIHEDAIHVTQTNVHPSSNELETDLAAMDLNRRMPLEELDLRAVQHEFTEECDVSALIAQQGMKEVALLTRSAREGTRFSASSSVY